MLDGRSDCVLGEGELAVENGRLAGQPRVNQHSEGAGDWGVGLGILLGGIEGEEEGGVWTPSAVNGRCTGGLFGIPPLMFVTLSAMAVEVVDEQRLSPQASISVVSSEAVRQVDAVRCDGAGRIR